MCVYFDISGSTGFSSSSGPVITSLTNSSPTQVRIPLHQPENHSSISPQISPRSQVSH